MHIKAFSKLTGVPETALRYYDEKGLLPAGRRENGYRFYTEEDAVRLRHIQELQLLGLELEEIRGILQDPDRLQTLLAEREPELEAALTRQEQTIGHLRAVRLTGLLPSELAPLQEVSAQEAAARMNTAHLDLTRLLTAAPELLDALDAQLDAFAVLRHEPPFSVEVQEQVQHFYRLLHEKAGVTPEVFAALGKAMGKNGVAALYADRKRGTGTAMLISEGIAFFCEGQEES